MNALEDVDSRLQRIKLETTVIEQHNERLENKKENALNKPAANTVVDSEVCDVIKLNKTSFTGSLNVLIQGIASHFYCPSHCDSWPVQHYLLVYMGYMYT